MLDLVGNPEDRFSHDRAHFVLQETKGELDEYDFNLIERDTASLNSDRQISLYCCSVN